MARSKKFERNDNNLAIAYYRFSSHAQNEASIDQQRELAHAWAEANGFKIVREYEDAAISGTLEERPGFQQMLSEVGKIKPNTLVAHAWAEANGFKIVREYEDAAISGTLEERPGFQQMLSEVGKIKPNTLVLWKTDRLGRDRYVLSMAKHAIRKAGCGIHLLAEAIPTETPEGVLMEGMMESFAEYYSLQLSMNVRRGMMYNAQNALYNGNKLFGYDVDKATKKYVVDEATAPFVQRMFSEYAEGVPMQDIAEELNGSGVRTVRGHEFTVKALNKMLKNRAYIGEYHHSGVVVEGGMPALVDEETFERVQARMTLNKRHGSQRARGKGEDGAPRYWLTGKLYCGECGARMQGMYGTGKMGKRYYYYNCSDQRRKLCAKKKIRKEAVEGLVEILLREVLADTENLASLAVDAAAYYRKNYLDTHYLEGLEAKRKEAERSIANLLKVIEGGVLSDAVMGRLAKLEEQKSALSEAIEAENVKAALLEDEHSIRVYFESGVLSDAVMGRLAKLEEQKSALSEAIEAENVKAALLEDEHSIRVYFEKFMNADFGNPETRNMVMEYFVDKLYLYDDKLVATFFYSEDKTELAWDEQGRLSISPFVDGEAAKFGRFPFGSTRCPAGCRRLRWPRPRRVPRNSPRASDRWMRSPRCPSPARLSPRRTACGCGPSALR